MKYQGYELIDWRDESKGSRDRAACWLLQHVGVGNTFTKRELRAAIAGVEQVDRRVRDLRPYRWQIDEHRDDSSLALNELRFVRAGIPVWVKAERDRIVPPVSDRIRQEVFKSDGHCCVRCGIMAGEIFDDSGARARLTLAHKYPGMLRPATSKSDFVTTCQRCNESLRELTDAYRDGDQVRAAIHGLPRRDRMMIISWIRDDRRPRSKLEEVYAHYRQLSAEERQNIRTWLDSLR